MPFSTYPSISPSTYPSTHSSKPMMSLHYVSGVVVGEVRLKKQQQQKQLSTVSTLIEFVV